ncbi:von Willebrand factor D and EGF domain-containing protein [Varanus komodoensis]|nr:von Willebrand factor D and EGF domain-containing protein [Varanus komodoensis]
MAAAGAAPGALGRRAWLLLFLASAGGALVARALPSKVARGVAVPFVFDPHAVCGAPCQNGALCIRNGTCFCPKGYEGERCQYATCYPKCKNGGKCLRPGKCRCQPGYGGRYCHKVNCEGGCQNGGECISVGGAVKCLCASGWTGSSCQEETVELKKFNTLDQAGDNNRS